MSIFRYDAGTSTKSWSSFVTWFNANKHGKMGTNVSIRVDANELYFEDVIHPGSNQYIVCICLKDSGNESVLWINGRISRVGHISSTNTGCLLRRAIMCANGILFEFTDTSSGTTNNGICDVGLIFDKNDEPVLLTRRGISSSVYRTPSTSNEWGIYGTSTSTLYAPIVVIPRYSSKRTTLAPICPESGTDDNYCPDCWSATRTQLSAEGLNAVRINGVDYITNGGIYIRDTSLE